MIQALRNAMALPDLRRKLVYTLLILIIYRLAAHVPVPGVDQAALEQLLAGTGGASQLFNLLDLLSGGAVANFSVMANGVYPYITASIIFQLLIPIFPSLERLQEEGEAGRRKLNQWQYYVTIPLAMLQAFGQARVFSAGVGSVPVLPRFGFSPPENILPTISVLVAMTAGTMFAIWLGDLITEQGIGNGLSLIIFSGIVARVPENIVRIWTQAQGEGGGVGMSVLMLGIFLVIMAVMMFVIVVVQ